MPNGSIAQGFQTGATTGGRFGGVGMALQNLMSMMLQRRTQQTQLQTGMMGSMLGAGYKPPAGFMTQMGLGGWQAPELSIDKLKPYLEGGQHKIKFVVDEKGGTKVEIEPFTPAETQAAKEAPYETFKKISGKTPGEVATARHPFQRFFGYTPSQTEIQNVMTQYGVSPAAGGGQTIPQFNTAEEALNSGLPVGTVVLVNGRRFQIAE